MLGLLPLVKCTSQKDTDGNIHVEVAIKKPQSDIDDTAQKFMIIILTAIQLVSDDDKESNASPKGVDSNRYFTEDPCDFPTSSSNNLLIGVFIRDLKKAVRGVRICFFPLFCLLLCSFQHC